jgi:hypothetical protein
MNINRVLREPRRMTPGVQSQIDQLDKAINQTENKQVILYRGLSVPLAGKTSLVEPAYSSTTANCSVADTFTNRGTRCCILKVTVPPSIKRYNYISDSDDDEEKENENEILLERGLEYYDIVDTKKRCGEFDSLIYECKVRKYVPSKSRSSSTRSKSITRNVSRSKSRSIQKLSSRPSSKKRISDDSLDKMLDDILKEGGGASRSRANRSKNGCYYRRSKRSRRGSRQSGSRR